MKHKTHIKQHDTTKTWNKRSYDQYVYAYALDLGYTY